MQDYTFCLILLHYSVPALCDCSLCLFLKYCSVYAVSPGVLFVPSLTLLSGIFLPAREFIVPCPIYSLPSPSDTQVFHYALPHCYMTSPHVTLSSVFHLFWYAFLRRTHHRRPPSYTPPPPSPSIIRSMSYTQALRYMSFRHSTLLLVLFESANFAPPLLTFLPSAAAHCHWP